MLTLGEATESHTGSLCTEVNVNRKRTCPGCDAPDAVNPKDRVHQALAGMREEVTATLPGTLTCNVRA